MKTLILFIICSALLLAQEITITSKPEPLTSVKTPAGKVVISPDGEKLAVTPLNLAGIVVYNLKTGAKTTLSENEFSGWGMSWNAASDLLASREKTNDLFSIFIRDTKGNQKFKSGLHSFISLPGWSNNGGSVTWVDEKGSVQTKVLNASSAGVSSAFQSNEMTLSNNTYTGGNSSVTFAGEFLSSAVSPDGSKTLLHIAGYGISLYDNASGTLYDLGKGEAPQWINNSFFLYTEVTDNGLKILKSDILAKKWDGTVTKMLTDEINEPVFFPTVSSKGDVYCTTEEGKIYKLSVKISE